MTCNLAGTGLGAKGQGIAAPVQPVSMDGSSGLGFQMPPPMFERRPLLRRRSSPPPRRCQTATLTARHLTLPCIKTASVQAAIPQVGQLCSCKWEALCSWATTANTFAVSCLSPNSYPGQVGCRISGKEVDCTKCMLCHLQSAVPTPKEGSLTLPLTHPPPVLPLTLKVMLSVSVAALAPPSCGPLQV